MICQTGGTRCGGVWADGPGIDVNLLGGFLRVLEILSLVPGWWGVFSIRRGPVRVAMGRSEGGSCPPQRSSLCLVSLVFPGSF